MAAASLPELEELIRTTGFYRNKAKSIKGAGRVVTEEFGGKVPHTMDELLRIPGVARKTANVVLGSWFGIAVGVVVDTHVLRISRRLELTKGDHTGKSRAGPDESNPAVGSGSTSPTRSSSTAARSASRASPAAPTAPSNGSATPPTRPSPPTSRNISMPHHSEGHGFAC